MAKAPAFLRRLADEARTFTPREAVHEIVAGFRRNDLLTYASAIAFRVVFAIIPLTLLGLALLGSFGLEGVWTKDVAPDVARSTSAAAFVVIDRTVDQVLGGMQFFWATLGAVIAVWAVSSGMRAVIAVSNRIYGADELRSFKRRLFVSIWLAALTTVLLLAAVASVKLFPRLVGDGVIATAIGWGVALVLLTATVAAIVRFAPNCERPLRWVSFGTLLVVGGWIAASLVYGWYVTSVANYGSVFGSLAVVMVTLGYVYLSTIVFLTGLQLDALIRREVEGGDEEPSPLIVARSVPAATSAQH